MQYIAIAISSGNQVEVPSLSERSDAQVILNEILRVRGILLTVLTGNGMDGALDIPLYSCFILRR